MQVALGYLIYYFLILFWTFVKKVKVGVSGMGSDRVGHSVMSGDLLLADRIMAVTLAIP